MHARRPGQHTRERTRRLARFVLLAIAAMVAIAVLLVLAADLSWWGIVAVELLVIAGLLALERFAAPVVDRWGRGAAGEEHVGRVLAALEADGWLTLHDVDTGRGNVDSIAVGPGGVVAIDVKSRGGRISPARIDPAWLRQAYAQKKWLESVSGRPADALLVLSRDEARDLHARLGNALG